MAGRPPAVARGPAVARDPAVFFADPNLNAQALFTVGAAGYGAAEYGEFATAVAGVHAAGDSYDSFYRAFRDLGRLASRFGHDALDRGNRAAARGAFLRAASYLANPLYVAIGTSHPRRQAAAYRAMNDAWVRAAGLLEPAAEPVQIPLRPDQHAGLAAPPARGRIRAPGGRPSSSTTATRHSSSACTCTARPRQSRSATTPCCSRAPGRARCCSGAGSGSGPTGKPSSPRSWITCSAWPDVDPDRIALVGWSQGGALAARAAAFEHRLAALVLDPGVSDFMAAFHLPGQLVSVARTQPAEADRAWAQIFARLPASVRFSFTKASYPFRQPTFSALVRALAEYGTAAYLPKISAPVLVTQYQGETAFPGQGAATMRLLRSAATRHEFTAAAGCQFHDAPMAPQRRNQVLFDWLDGVL